MLTPLKCVLQTKDQAPVLQQHEATLEGTPPEELLDTDLYCRRVDWQGEQYHAGGNRPVMVVNPPGPDAAAIHLQHIQQICVCVCVCVRGGGKLMVVKVSTARTFR